MCNKVKYDGFLHKLLHRAFGIVMVIVMFGFVSFVVFLINKVISGHGLDYYISGMGYEFNYLGVLILVFSSPLIGLVVWLISWYRERDWRAFKDRYLKKNGESHD